jgi:hypothetical protein
MGKRRGQQAPAQELVTLGVDPHKHSWTVVGLDQRCRVLA